jgi:hypothetical protein
VEGEKLKAQRMKTQGERESPPKIGTEGKEKKVNGHKS